MVYKDFSFLGYSLEKLFWGFQNIYIFYRTCFINDKMVLRAKENVLGAWAFLIGVILAVVIGVGTSLISIPSLTKFSAEIYGILVLLGIIVGFVNVQGRESQTFLYTGTILVIVSKFGMESVQGSLIGIGIGEVVTSVFAALLALFVPATIIVALKTVFNIANV